MLASCSSCKRIAPPAFTFRAVEDARIICVRCGESKIPLAARCVICANPAAERTYLFVKFANFPEMPTVITPTCSRECQEADVKRDPPAEPGKETFRGCAVCAGRLPEGKTVQCQKCDIQFCTTKCRDTAAAKHEKTCRPLPVGDERPCELAFASGGKYALFDKPLVFPSGGIAAGYIGINPPPPPGIEWEKIFKRESKREVRMDTIMNMAKGVTEHGEKFALHVIDSAVEFQQPEFFGTREIAVAWASRLFPKSRWEVKPV